MGEKKKNNCDEIVYFFYKPVRQCVTLQIERGGGGGEKETDRPPYETLRLSSASGYNENTQHCMQVKSFVVFFACSSWNIKLAWSVTAQSSGAPSGSLRCTRKKKKICNLAFDFNPHKPRSICSLFTRAGENKKQTLTDINLIGKSCERSVKEPQ